MDYDVVIIGAGVAGCSAAINLPAHLRVAVIDQSKSLDFKIGESLPPAVKRLFKKMQLWEDFKQQGHLPCYGNRAIWANNQLQETDFIRDIDGHGWHLDRVKFEQWLVKIAHKNAQFYSKTEFIKAVYIAKQWQITLKNEDIKARLIIDASGRTSPFSKRLKIQKQHTDQMVSSWLKGTEIPHRNDTGFSFIQATEKGWWYSASIPNQERILSFHTDARLDHLKNFRDAKVQLATAQQYPLLAELLERCQFQLTETQGYTAAHSTRLSQFSGQAWLAAGDAALSMDPISSQGMFNALYTGLLAATQGQQWLNHEIPDFKQYHQSLEQIWQAYQQHLKYWYQVPEQWQQSDFWKLKKISI